MLFSNEPCRSGMIKSLLFAIIAIQVFSMTLHAQMPEISNLSLTSVSGNYTTDDDLVCSYSLSGDATTAVTAWYRNGQPIMSLYLPFEGGNASALTDISGQALTVTAVGGVIWRANGGHDGFGAYEFHGTDYLTMSNGFPTNSSYTKTAWIYRTPNNQANNIISGSEHIFRVTNDGRLGAGHKGDPRMVQGLQYGGIYTNQWYFAAVSFDYISGRMILYQDGVPVDTAIVPSDKKTITNSSMTVGSVQGSYNWIGNIDDARVYNFVLSEAEIKNLFVSGGENKIVAAETEVNDVWQAQVIPFSSSSMGILYQSNLITIQPSVPSFISSSVTTAIKGKKYIYDVNALGGPTPTYHLTLSPFNMTIDTVTGLIYWIPEISGIFSVSITANNSTGIATQDFQVTVNEPTVGISNLTLSTIADDSLQCNYGLTLQATTSATAWYRNGQPQLILYMPFEGGPVFSLDDASGRGITALQIGNNAYNSSGGYDGKGSWEFDGTNYLIAGNIFPTRSSYTKTAWIYRTVTGEFNHIISGWNHFSSISGGHAFRVNHEGRLSAGQNGVWRIVESPAGAIASNRWYFAAVTFNYATGEMNLYIDGVRVSNAIVASNMRDVTDPGILIGATEGAHRWKGKLDEIRVYDRSLTPEQINSLYLKGGNYIVKQETVTGETWQAQVTAYSSTEASTPLSSSALIIGNPNQSPILVAIGPKSTTEGQNLTFDIMATDPDGVFPSLSVLPSLNNASFLDNGDGTGIFNFNPDFTQAGAYNLTFSASDGFVSVSEIVPISVTNVNRQPVLAFIGSQTAVAGGNLSFTISATDPDSEIPDLFANSVPLNATFSDGFNGTGQFIFNPGPSQAGVYSVSFMAVDASLAADTEIVSISVVDTTLPGEWSAIIRSTGEVIGNASNISEVIIGTSNSEILRPAVPAPPEYSTLLQLWRTGMEGPYYKDLRIPGDQCYYWIIEVDPHGNVGPISTPQCATLSWNPVQFNSQRHYQLHEGLTADGPVVVADMRTTTEYQVCDIQTSKYFTIQWLDDNCAGKTWAEISLLSGWNLISIPVIPEDSSLGSLFPTALAAYEFNGIYAEAIRIEPCRGYWLQVPSDITVTIFGQPVTDCSATTMPPGWALFGAPACSAQVQSNPPGNIDAVFGFSGIYEPATQLKSGKGYWIKLIGQSDLDISCGGMAPSRPIIANGTESDFEAMTLHIQGVNMNGVNRSNCIIGIGPTDYTYVAPPSAPFYSVKMEIYRPDGTGPFYEDISGNDSNINSWIIAVYFNNITGQQDNYSAVLSWDIAGSGSGLYELSEGIGDSARTVIQNMTDVSRYSINAGGGVKYFTVTRKESSGIVPVDYRVSQNYPNPFNPSTTIEYFLPNRSHVTIAIYNVLGQKVQTLVDETQSAGGHIIDWNSTDQADRTISSGIYLYHFQADDHVETKKMMLIK